MHYSLFFPDRVGSNEEHFTQVGLDKLRGTGAQFVDLRGRGPGGKSGVYVTWQPFRDAQLDPPLDYDPSWNWVPAKGSEAKKLEPERYWFGFNPNEQPHPVDLRFQEQQPGYLIELRDGNSWVIPAAPRLTSYDVGLNDKGEVEQWHQPQHQLFCERASELTRDIFSALDLVDVVRDAGDDDLDRTPVPMDIHGAWEHCCEALGMNYRVTPEMIDHLGLFDSSNMARVLCATIDLPQIQEVRDQKKTHQPVVIHVG